MRTASGKGGHREGERVAAEADVLYREETSMWPDTKSGHTSPSLHPQVDEHTGFPWPHLL